MQPDIAAYESIWLADDDKDDCEFFQDVLLETLPHARLTVLANAGQLMNLFAAGGKPDMLFLDMLMPGKNGLDCLAEIRALPQAGTFPIVALSGSLYLNHIQLAYTAGANLFVEKPASFPKLARGLDAVFKLDWSDPAAITRAHYRDNKFVPFAY